MAAEPLRDDQNRFAAALLGEAELFQAVAGTARFARPREPELLTQQQFDDNRAAAGFPGAPTAKVVAWRLRDRDGASFPWRDLVRVALEEARPDRVMIARTRLSEHHELGLEHLRSALQMVAGLRGQGSISPLDYTETSERLFAIYRRRRKLDVIAAILPSLGQIERIAKRTADAEDTREPWDIALGLAGLDARPPAISALPVVAALLLFADETDGAFCSGKQLRLWASARGIALERGRGQSSIEYRQEAARQRRAAGLSVRRKLVRAKDAIAKAPEAYANLPRAKRAGADRSNPAPAVARYVESLTGKARPSRLGYLEWRRTNEDAPAPSGFLWSETLAEAQKLIAERRRRSEDR